MSETAEPDIAELQAELARVKAELAAMAPVTDAAALYVKARLKLPPPGKEFTGPKDAEHFQAAFVALLALERAAVTFTGRSIKQ